MRFLVLACALMSPAALADTYPTKARLEKGREIITPCSLVLKGTLPSGTFYELVLRESVFVRDPKAQEDDEGLWGIDGGFPWTTISTFSLTLNGQHVSIRRKYFGDLVNINAIAVSERQKDIIVSISGGDAAGSFQGEFVVRNNMLAEWIIRMGEMPEEYWERIVTHNELWTAPPNQPLHLDAFGASAPPREWALAFYGQIRNGLQSFTMNQRKYLVFATVSMAIITLAGFLYPLGQSLQPTDVIASKYIEVVDLNTIASGELKKINLGIRSIMVLHRTKEDLEALKKLGSILKDPDSRESDQPQFAVNPYRSLIPEFFISYAFEPHWGAPLEYYPKEYPEYYPTDFEWYGGFRERWDGALFDKAGRVYHFGHPAERNIPIPKYTIDRDYKAYVQTLGPRT